MTTYSQSTAHQIVQSALGFTVTPEQAATVARNLGIEVEDPKPEPGIYLHENGQLVILIGDGCKEYSQYTTAVHNSHWADVNRDKLTPARVVPAEPVKPVELTEWQIENLFNSQRFGNTNHFYTYGEDLKGTIGAAINEALAKYGHGN